MGCLHALIDIHRGLRGDVIHWLLLLLAAIVSVIWHAYHAPSYFGEHTAPLALSLSGAILILKHCVRLHKLLEKLTSLGWDLSIAERWFLIDGVLIRLEDKGLHLTEAKRQTVPSKLDAEALPGFQSDKTDLENLYRVLDL